MSEYGEHKSISLMDEYCVQLGNVFDTRNRGLALLTQRAVERMLRAEANAQVLEKAVADRTVDLASRNAELSRAIEQLEMAKAEAEAASTSKSAVLANMSHELRTPLNAIIGFSELMRSEAFGPLGHQTYVGYVNDIHFTGAHLLQIINDILDLGSLEAGELKLNYKVTD